MAELSRTHLLIILVVSFTIASILITLPAEYEEEEENRRGGTTTTTRTRKPTLVPTVIFNTLPSSTFQAFVIALVFAFASSLSALLIHDAENHNGKRGRISRLVTRLFGCVSLASITLALAILSWALLLTAAACWEPSISGSLLALPKRSSINQELRELFFRDFLLRSKLNKLTEICTSSMIVTRMTKYTIWKSSMYDLLQGFVGPFGEKRGLTSRNN